jgi:hypothetical protein
MEIGFVRSRDSSDRPEKACYGTELDGIRDFYRDPSLIPRDGEARKPAKMVQERADLLNTLVAYTGTYRLEGEKWITNVDVAWNPE